MCYSAIMGSICFFTSTFPHFLDLFIPFYSVFVLHYYSKLIYNESDKYKQIVSDFGLQLEIYTGPYAAHWPIEYRFHFIIDDRIIFSYTGKKAYKFINDLISDKKTVQDEIRKKLDKQRKNYKIFLNLKQIFEYITIRI